MVNENTYPIYYFSAKWSQKADIEKYKDSPNWTIGLPKGRIWDSTGFSKMFKEEKEQKELDGIIMEWWDKYIQNEKFNGKEVKLLYLKVEFKEKETWHCTWFQHETFDTGQTDIEVLQSFERFVSRKEDLNQQFQDLHDRDQHCLMGAEDRWRWHGGRDENGDNTPAPCRCEHCKKQGLIRIAH